MSFSFNIEMAYCAMQIIITKPIILSKRLNGANKYSKIIAPISQL
ncbi:hypothetical protein LGFR6_04040 [Lactococcus garvieae]